MKIGIITIHKSPNYGACLQSYALVKYLEQKGYEVEIIDLHRPYQSDYVESKKYVPFNQKERTIRTRLKDFFCVFFRRRRNKVIYLSKESQVKFDSFNAQLNYSRAYYGIDELYKNPPIYDVYITGSDQVWNPSQPYCVEPYFLTFAPKGKFRMSYAASLGQDSIPEKIIPDYIKWLNQYDVISVRELRTSDYLSKLAKIDIYTVADPTFLLDKKHWNDIAVNPQVNKPYILYFTLNPDSDLLSYAIRLSEESGIRLINFRSIIPEYYDGAPYTTVTDAGPREFLGYLGGAEMVITNSFHGSVISLLMSTKNVFTYISPTNTKGVRIEELYKLVNLENHILRNDLSKGYEDLCNMYIDYKMVDKLIDAARQKSRKFLLDNLKNG